MDDRLPHPPDGVGDELDVLRWLEPLGGLDQAYVSLIDEIEEGQSAVPVFLGEADDKPQVGLHQCAQRLPVASLNSISEDLLLLGRDAWQFGNLLEILLQGLGRGG